MIESIIFDLDGVLFDGCELHARTFLAAVKQWNPLYHIDMAYHNEYLNGLSTRQKLSFLVQKGLIQEVDVDPIMTIKQQITAEELSNVICHSPRLQTMCIELSKSYNLFCVSNSIRSTVETCLKGLGIRPFFLDVITNEDVKNPKPDPEPYLTLFRRNRLLSARCLIVEDSPRGVASARASGGHVLQVAGPHEVTLEKIIDSIRVLNATM